MEGGGCGVVEGEKPQSDDRKAFTTSDVVWKRSESPGSLMYAAEGDSLSHVSISPCPPLLYWTMALYTNGMRPSISLMREMGG